MKKIFLTLMLFFGFAAVAGHADGKEEKHPHVHPVKVEIGKKGFKSEKPLNFKKGEEIVLDITRTTKKTCMTEIQHPKTKKTVELPLNKETRINLGSYTEAKEIKLLCGMNMTAGVVHVK